MISRVFMPPAGGDLKRTYLWTVLAGLIYAGSSFVMSMAVSNLLGAAAAGVFAIAMSIGNQLVTVGYFNMRTFQVSDVRETYSFGDYCGFRLLTVVVMTIAGIVWIAVGGYRGEKCAVIMLMIGFRICEAFSDLLEGRYQQRGRYDVSCRGVFAKTLLYLLAFILTMALTKSLLWAMAALGLSYLLSILVIDGSLLGAFGGFSLRFSRNIQGRLLICGLPLFLNSFLTTYIFNAAKYSMDRYYSNEHLGIFNALYMMAFVVNLFSGFVLKPLLNPLSVLFAKGDFSGFGHIIRRQVVLIGAITLLCTTGAYFLGIPVLSLLFGISLEGYRGALCVLLLGGCFTALYQLMQYGIVIMRHQTACFAGCGITAVLTFCFTPLLVKRFDIAGAACSYFSSMVLMAAVVTVIFFWCFRGEYKKSR